MTTKLSSLAMLLESSKSMTDLTQQIADVLRKHQLWNEFVIAVLSRNRRAWWCSCGTDCLKTEGSHYQHVAEQIVAVLKLTPTYAITTDWRDGEVYSILERTESITRTPSGTRHDDLPDVPDRSDHPDLRQRIAEVIQSLLNEAMETDPDFDGLDSPYVDRMADAVLSVLQPDIDTEYILVDRKTIEQLRECLGLADD